jgi:hypothetical protein
MDEAEPIDLVYTWVDGEDPAVLKQLAAHDEEIGEENRHSLPGQLRDLGEIRFSIRSVLRNMDWVGTIYIVTNGQELPYLKGDDRLRFVSHAAIFARPDDLPVFNSLSIECNLHRIPGLSERFIYMNNDLFVGRPVKPDDFVDAQGRDIVLFEPLRLSMEAEGHDHVRLLNFNDGLLAAAFGPGPRLVLPHTPQLYRRSACEEVVRTWPAEIAATSAQRFRRGRSAFFRLLYTYRRLYQTYGLRPLQEIMVANHAQVRLATAEDVRTLTLASQAGQVAAAFDTLEAAMPRFFCVQDHLWQDFGAYRDLLRSRLERIFPTPTRYERLP